MTKIYAVGETTYDIIFRNGQPDRAVVGGSVLNTSVSLGRLGLPVTFISRMGNDQVGNLSVAFLKQNNINCDYVKRFDGNSRLALAFLDANNNAVYEFYKAEKSPSLYFPEINDDNLVVFGSTNALRDEGRNSLLLFLNQAHDKNVLTLYDPNIREFNPIEMVEVRKKVMENLHLTKILKGSTEDFKRLYNTSQADQIFEMVNPLGVEVLIVTAGSDPIELRTADLSLSMPVLKVNTVSTIGAGDNFSAGLVFGMVKAGFKSANIQWITKKQWAQIIDMAITLSAEVCQSDSNYISTEYAREFLKKVE